MSRADYSDDLDSWDLIRWRGAVKSAIRGKRGQKLLQALRDALAALPEKKLVRDSLRLTSGEVCALGALGNCRGIDMTEIDPDDYETVAKVFEISEALTREIVYQNDDGGSYNETPEQRYARMLKWVNEQIVPEKSKTKAVNDG